MQTKQSLESGPTRFDGKLGACMQQLNDRLETNAVVMHRSRNNRIIYAGGFHIEHIHRPIPVRIAAILITNLKFDYFLKYLEYSTVKTHTSHTEKSRLPLSAITACTNFSTVTRAAIQRRSEPCTQGHQQTCIQGHQQTCNDAHKDINKQRTHR
jgi:hypothetical protein